MQPSPKLASTVWMYAVGSDPINGNCRAFGPRLGSHGTARDENRRFSLLSALCTHTKAPYKTVLLWETSRPLKRPKRSRTGRRGRRLAHPAERGHCVWRQTICPGSAGVRQRLGARWLGGRGDLASSCRPCLRSSSCRQRTWVRPDSLAPSNFLGWQKDY